MAAVVVLIHLAGFLSSIDAVMRARTAQGSIAWTVLLNTFPYLSLPAYWVFGSDKFQGYVVARRDADQRNKDIEEEVAATVERFRVDGSDRPAAMQAAERLALMPTLGGNRVELLVDGEATFNSILSGIDEAEKYVLVQFYTIHDDGLGGDLKDRLLTAADRGVKAYLVYDGIGSHSLPASYIDELRDAGVEVYEFNDQAGRRYRFQINFRNHRKIVVVDGQVAWLGGHNVGDEYLGKDPDFGDWRDTHMRIEGPAALTAQISFVEDWNWATGSVPDLCWTGKAAADGSDSHVLIIPSGPADELETATLMFLHAITSARERIWIASPYFVPDTAILAALQLASLRGVDVRVVVPKKPDHLLVHLAAFSYFDDACSTGTQIYRYQEGFLHQKVMLIDDQMATVGTANFDNRSFRLNFEITAAVTDPAFVAEVEQMFEDDFERSRLMEDGEYECKPWWFRLGVQIARLAAPIL